jgi:hypothetical protein
MSLIAVPSDDVERQLAESGSAAPSLQVLDDVRASAFRAGWEKGCFFNPNPMRDHQIEAAYRAALGMYLREVQS